MINVQNFIQILHLVLSDCRLIRRNIQYMSKHKLISILIILEQSPFQFHSLSNQNRQALVKRKLNFVANDLNESFAGVTGTYQLEVSINDPSSACEYQEAKSDLI